jgi:hypothetical protein
LYFSCTFLGNFLEFSFLFSFTCLIELSPEAINAQMAQWGQDRCAVAHTTALNDMYGQNLNSMKEKLKTDTENMKLKHLNEQLKAKIRTEKLNKRSGKGKGRGGRGRKGDGGKTSKGRGGVGGKAESGVASGKAAGEHIGNRSFKNYEDSGSENDEFSPESYEKFGNDEYVLSEYIDDEKEEPLAIESSDYEWKYDENYENMFASARGVSVGKRVWVFENATKTLSSGKAVRAVYKPDKTLGEDKWNSVWEVAFWDSESQEASVYNYNYWALFGTKTACKRYWKE